MATEACRGGTPDLGFFSGVSVFIGIFGVGFCWGTLQKIKNFLWFHQDPSMSSSKQRVIGVHLHTFVDRERKLSREKVDALMKLVASKSAPIYFMYMPLSTLIEQNSDAVDVNFIS